MEHPDLQREAMLAALGERSNADLCAWFLATSENSVPTLGRMIVWERDPGNGAHLTALLGAPLPHGTSAVPGDKPWMKHHIDSRYAPRKVRNRFRSFGQEVADMVSFRQTALWEQMYAPGGIEDQSRMLVYDDHGSLVGWVGAMARQPFQTTHKRSLDTPAFRQQVRNTFVDAFRLDLVHQRDVPRPSSFLCTSGGEPVAYGDGVQGWVEAHRRELRDILSTTQRKRVQFLLGALAVDANVVVHNVRGETFWACHITTATLPRLSPLSELTPRQRTIARHAATGATNTEIAQRLNISPGTVKAQLTAIYRRLNIDRRVDLAMVLKP